MSEKHKNLPLAVVSLISILAAFYQTFSPPLTIPTADSVIYIKIAFYLSETGLFTDFNGINSPGQFFAPLYISIISLLTKIDPNLYQLFSAITNDVAINEQLSGLRIVLAVQAMMGAGIYLFIYKIFEYLTNKPFQSLFGLLLIIISGAFSEYFTLILNETTSFLLFTASLYFWVKFSDLSNTSYKVPIILGLLMGLLVLTRPSYIYLSYAFIFYYAVTFFLWPQQKNQDKIRKSLFYVISFALTISPWIIRNYLNFSNFAITDGYASVILTQRVYYNLMNWQEYWASFIYWFPKYGETLAQLFLNEEHYYRLGWQHPESFYDKANKVFIKESILAAGGQEKHQWYLIKNYILADLFKHFAVTIPIMIRGMWAGSYLSILGIISFVPTLIILKRNDKLKRFLFFIFPSIFMLIFHASVSVNVVRYNIPLVTIYGLSSAIILTSIAEWFYRKFLRKNPFIRL